MSRFWSPIVQRLVPYTPGEQPRQKFIKLNTNENPYGPSPAAIEAIREAVDDRLRLYPDPEATDLRAAIAETLGLGTDHVFLGNGSDEVLAHAFNAFFGGGTSVAFADVTYSFYTTYCELYGLRYREIPLDGEFSYDPADYAQPSGGIVIANPNAPTGIAMPLAKIELILEANPDTVVILDEAYVDFGAASALGLVPRFENLLVVQTFSKSRSLAGLRVGFAVGQPHLIEGLRRIKDSFNSYPLGRLALAGGLAAWKDRDWYEDTRARVIAERQRMVSGLESLGFRVLPSAANFVFVSHPSKPAEALLHELRGRGILVRHFRKERIRDWLRISVGTAQECDQLVAALSEILSGNGTE